MTGSPKVTSKRATLREIGAWPVFSVFFLEAFVLGNWIPRIPDVKADFGFSASQLGLALFALSFGTLFAFLTAGWIVGRLGLRRANMVALSFWAIFVGLAPAMPSGLVLGVVLLGAGFSVGLQEVAMNTAAEEVAQSSGVQIMSRSHGFWSLGSLAGALVGTAFAWSGFSTASHFAIVMPLTVIAGLYSSLYIDNSIRETSAGETGGAAKIVLPNRDIFMLCLLPIGIMLVEGAFIDWSAVFVRTVLDGGPIAVGFVYAAFSAVMAATRLSGDYLVIRYGALRIARVSALAATLGIVLFSFAPNIPIAFLAALISGLGVAIVYPLCVTAVARRPGKAEDNVAAISLFGFTAFMFAPPIIGFLADWIGLKYALFLIAPFAATSYLLSAELEKGGEAQ